MTVSATATAEVLPIEAPAAEQARAIRDSRPLRLITCGSVDDGKSTLIGRLLYDSKQIFEDQLSALESDSRRVGTQGQEIDFALLVDGLAAEREQGITIDVAYRFFATEKRKFIVADTPGHEQYTRNMVTGASTADLAVVMVDARKGVLTQTRRHSYLVSLLGIRRVVLAVNKLDLVDYRQDVFEAIGAHAAGKITGKLNNDAKTQFHTTGLIPFPDDDRALLAEHDVIFKPKTHEAGFVETWLPILLFPMLIIGFFVFMQRRAQGQMGNIMSIGRSRAKTYSTERPGTTFADVAGYEGVKTEIREVVDFLKYPEKFGQIGARIPKGVLLVGPPGTGKTLIARAVAGEAGVPFLSVSGSDFMEMFVGVGASRVRDLFQSARKLGRAIIFVDEIDSIGRKRGAGLGGGHDEREQTLNQMLSEMDGFEATEGIVMMAATNRPDILDPALLRPGRFDRQVVVPLPEAEERLAILNVHTKDKKIAKDVDLMTVSKGTPGMSGADLANLVNEAALFAVRRGDDQVHMIDFESARDRVLMGMRRDSMALSDNEKEAIAYHEAGHAVCAAVLPTADPVHKVTIIPSGMALGVTQQLPAEEKHIYRQNYIEDQLVIRMGGRIAEDLVFDLVSTGEIGRDSTVLYAHLGGQPALNAYSALFRG